MFVRSERKHADIGIGSWHIGTSGKWDSENITASDGGGEVFHEEKTSVTPLVSDDSRDAAAASAARPVCV